MKRIMVSGLVLMAAFSAEVRAMDPARQVPAHGMRGEYWNHTRRNEGLAVLVHSVYRGQVSPQPTEDELKERSRKLELFPISVPDIDVHGRACDKAPAGGRSGLRNEALRRAFGLPASAWRQFEPVVAVSEGVFVPAKDLETPSAVVPDAAAGGARSAEPTRRVKFADERAGGTLAK